nr:helix-turn-helix transcriptional regulator [uncultured Merdimonas sp.]
MEQRAEILRNLMEEKGMKVSDIVKISGLPYSTVKAILERGAEKAGYVNVCKICNALGISADELEKMVSDKTYTLNTIAAHFDGDEYTEEELNEIRQFADFVKKRRRES